MDLINDIRFDLATAYFNNGGVESIAHRRLDRDNARSLIDRLEQVYAQILASHEKAKTTDASVDNRVAQTGSH